MLEKFLVKLGLSEKEAQVYLALLEVGTNAASVVAKKSGLTRTTAYSVLDGLVKKRFATSYERKGLKVFSAEDPRHIEYLLGEKAREAEVQKEKFGKLMPEFLRFAGRFEHLPKVRYFEGFSGVKEIYEDTLKVGQDKLAYSSVPDVGRGDFQDFIKEYLGRRVELGLKVRAILPDSVNGREFAKRDSKVLRESRLVDPEIYPFRSEINIYGDRVAIMSLQSGLMHGVIIESESIAETERSIFELAWKGAAAS